MDKYKSFAQLQQREKENQDYRINSRQGTSGILIIAPHGGGIEPGTTELALAVAEPEHSFYSFEGWKRSGNKDLHITSTNFDEPLALEIISSSRTLIALHGCDDEEEITYLGGLDERFKAVIKQSLMDHGFVVRFPHQSNFGGEDAENLCNRTMTKMGVQLELSNGLRKKMFQNLTYFGRLVKTPLFKTFVVALRTAISNYQTETIARS